MASTCGDLFDGLLFPSLHDTCEPHWLLASDCPAVDAAQHCPASSAASPCDKQHPLLRPWESEETTEDVFDSLDAFLAAEFPELDSKCIPELASPVHSSSYGSSPASSALPAVAIPAFSCSSTDSHGMQLMQQYQQQAFACSSPTSSGAPDVAESAAAAAAAAAAAKAQAQAFASLTSSPISGMDASSLGRLGSTASITTCSAAVTAAAGTTGAISRWKLYHMQQRQELLAPKAASSKASKLQIIAGQGAAAAPAGSCGGRLSAMSSGAACLSPVNALASTAVGANAGVATVAVPAQMVGAEQLLLLNLHQQQQLALQQQQCAMVVGAKRQWAEPVGALIPIMPCKAKRSRVTAAGNTAAQHMYGLSAEPCQQTQTLQVLQLQLQQQIQQNYQQQAEIYQQQQLQALHNQLHMRLQVQQHPLAFQPPTQTRHKRQATRVAKC